MGTRQERGQVVAFQKRACYSMLGSLEDSEEPLKREGAA